MDKFQSRLFRHLFDNELLIIIYVDEEDKIFDANNQISQLGFSKKEAVGTRLQKILPQAETRLIELVDQTRKTGSEARWEGKLVHRDGKPRDFNGTLTSLPHPSGKRLVVLFLWNVTPLKETQRRLYALHDSAVEIGRAETTDLVYDLCMKVVSEVLGWENRSVSVPEGDTILYIRDNRSNPQEHFKLPLTGKSISARTFTTGKTQLVNDLSKDPDYAGSPPYLSPVKALLMAPIIINGSVRGSINVGSDKTGVFTAEDVALLETLAQHAASALLRIEKKREDEKAQAARTEEALANAEKVIQMARHDLKGPLQTIMVTTYLLRKSHEEEKEQLDAIDQSVKFARTIIDDLRKKAIAADLDYVVADFSEVLEKAIGDAAIPKSVRLDERISPCFISLDPSKMRRVFYNLLKNAVEAVGENGEITVSTETLPDAVRVTITDNGKGIPEASMPLIFSYGYTTKKAGSGLGLFFCKEMIEAHGGVIEVSSTQGSGTSVKVTLPLKPVTRLQDEKAS